MTRPLRFAPVRLLSLLAVLCLVGGAARAQSPLGRFGNEWIQPGQPYYKIKVGQRGIHRLSQAWLAAAGIAATTDPRRLQLWRRGQEQAIYVAGETDGSLDATDYVDFWGLPNDALLEKELFKDPSWQVSELVSTYSDTAAYFLTVVPAGVTPLRMQQLTSAPGGLAPVRHSIQEVVQVPANLFYLQGPVYNSATRSAMSWHDKAEGFTGRDFATSGAIRVPVTVAPDTLRLTPRLLLKLASRSFTTRTVTIDLMRVTSATASVFVRTLTQTTTPLQPFGHALYEVPLRYADLAGRTEIELRVTVNSGGAGAPDAFTSINYARLAYAAVNALGGQGRLLLTDSTQAGSNSQYLLFDTPPAAAVGYDVTNPFAPIRIAGQTAGAQWGMVVPTAGPGARRVFIANDAAPRVPPPGRRAVMRTYAPSPGAYLIIAGRKLLTDSTGRQPVREYARYRASAAGGSHDTLTAIVDQLYDAFFYGDPSPIAIRRFVKFLNSGSAPINYLFLVGKGIEAFARDGNFGSLAYNRARFAKDILPAMGYPASDVLFTADFRNNRYAPLVPTGRLSANYAFEVEGYLDKVRAHEGAPLADWRKNVLHLGGGKNQREQSQFSGYLNTYAAQVEDSLYLGGRVESILRGNVSSPVTSVNVSTQVNNGLSLITFFGHSSPNTSDIDIGTASDPLNNYRNAGRYPVIVMNGCQVGNTFLDARSFGEDWMLTPQRGALAFLAYAGYGLPAQLDMYCRSFYRSMFNDSAYYGRSLGQQQKRTVERAITPMMAMASIPEDGIAQLTQVVLQADPAVRIYSPERPDYVISNASVALLPLDGERLTARASGLKVRVVVRNLGRATADSVRVRVRRTFANSTPMQTVEQIFQPIVYSDTLVLTIPNLPGTNVQGTNQFEIVVDWPDSVREMNELNNLATISHSFPLGSVYPLLPQEFSLVPTSVPTLVGQYDQPLSTNRDYTFELDTVPSFTSPILVRQLLNADRYPIWRPTMPATAGQDSVVWYWRFRPQTILPGEDSTWATSSFRHVPASSGGWSQSHYGQFVRAPKVSVRQAAPSGRWSYTPTLLRLMLRTTSGDSVRFSSTQQRAVTFEVPPNGIRHNATNLMRPTAYTVVSNLILMVFDPNTLEPVSSKSTFNGRLIISDTTSYCGQDDRNIGDLTFWMYSGYGQGEVYGPVTGSAARGLVHVVRRPGSPATYDNYLTTRVDSVESILRHIPDGYIVAMVSANRVPFDSIRVRKPGLMNQIRALGSVVVDSLHDGDPFVIIGTKGGAPGTAIERTYDRTLPGRWGQTVHLDTTRSSFEPRGRVTSTVIGPVQRWLDVIQTVKRDSSITSSYSLQVVPIDATGRDGTPIPVVIPAAPINSTSSFALGGLLNAAQYPKARLELATQDTLLRRSPQLEQWLVTYEGVPEGVVRVDRVPADSLVLTAQAERGRVKLRVPFQNISTVRFRDSLAVDFTLLKGGTVWTTRRVKIGALAPDSLGWALSVLRTDTLRSGDYVLRAVVNPGNLQPEQYDFNNTLEAAFRIEIPNLAPLVDVAFDGQHILDYDIVAPAPAISVSVRDEDKRISPKPEDVDLVLYPIDRGGNRTGPKRELTGTSPGVTAQLGTATKPLMLTFGPGQLTDGFYQLDVQARDYAGNLAAAAAYKSRFQVINETMISNFYPYPNPFSTSTRFLFTITGKVPQNLKIQIMTVTGKVVREIMKEELGTDLRVGHNTSTATWNGTDEYGDRLANGVYLYRVVVQDSEESFKTFKTAGDNKAFHKTWGKLYILR